MDQPLGRFAGNAWEVFECVEIMKNKSFITADGIDLYADTRELSLQLSAQMIHISGKTSSVQQAYEMATDALVSGRALEIFEKMCLRQSGNLGLLKLSEKKLEVKASTDGYLASLNVEKIGIAGILLKAGRMATTDIIVPTSGIEFHKRIGSSVKKGDTLFTIHGDDSNLFSEAEKILSACYQINLQKPVDQVLIKEVVE